MDRAFIRGYRSPVKRQPVIFGLQLRPLTLGHLFLLSAIDSPILNATAQTKIELADLGAAVFACAHEHRKAVAAFDSWWFPIFARVWGWFAKPHWITRDIEQFWEYMKDGMSSPEIRPVQRDGGRTCEAPGPWIKLLFAMHVLGLSKEQSMDMEVLELNVLYATWAEWNGSGELVNTDAINELWEFARQQDSKRFNPDGTRREALN